MSFQTGMFRLAAVIRWIGRIVGGLVLAGSIALLVMAPDKGGDDKAWAVIGVAVFGELLIADAAVVAWIIEGFAKD
jgi:hypothetical protein